MPHELRGKAETESMVHSPPRRGITHGRRERTSLQEPETGSRMFPLLPALHSADQMDTLTPKPPAADRETPLVERLRAAVELLEAIDANRGLLAGAPAEEVQRLLQATRKVSEPDHRARRKLVKASARQRKAARTHQAETLLSATGIRELRRKPVFTTPNVYPPKQVPPDDPDEAPARELGESQHCYVCKQHYVQVHHFYDQLCP